MINFVTCLSKINKGIEEEKAQSHLIIGTEQRHIIILEPNGMKEKKRFTLASVPVFIQAIGQLDVDYKIYIACRDGKIYIIKQNAISDLSFDIENKPVGMIYSNKCITIGGMNHKINSYFEKGKKNFSIYLPHSIVCMEKMEMQGTKAVKCILVALSNKEIRMYNGKYLLNIIKGDDVVMGMAFGVLGREEGSLVINYKSGGLAIKMLQRQANLEVSTQRPGPSSKQDIPLNVPKKTKLFVELTKRERDNSVSMHRQF
jgi:Bardet-Biedl syndrome 1 protein